MRLAAARAWPLIVLWIFAAPAAWAQLPWVSENGGRPSLAPLLEDVTPAVVNISVVSRQRRAPNPLLDDPFFRRFFDIPEQPRSIPRQAAGSGVIIDAERGHVLTNHHVIENADAITVTLADRRRFDAELVGSDPETDIALLQIDARGLTAIELGDSDTLEVGDFVVAIGNPFGLGQTVTSGIVSAVKRSGLGIEGYEDFIQTDASINPGNSGGALVDLNGELVGINTAIVAPAGGNVGIGFAVPIAMAREVARQLIEYGEVRRGQLGIQIQDLTPDLSEALELDVDRGAVVVEVFPDSAAERAGLQAGDVITELNGVPVASMPDLRNRIGLMPIGEEVRLTVLRDGRRLEIEAEIGGEATASAGRSGGRGLEQLDGAELSNLGPSHPRYGQIEGVLVTSVAPGSPAARNGLREGDIVTAVNRTPVRNVRELTDSIRSAAGSAIALNVIRGNARLFLVIR